MFQHFSLLGQESQSRSLKNVTLLISGSIYRFAWQVTVPIKRWVYQSDGSDLEQIWFRTRMRMLFYAFSWAFALFVFFPPYLPNAPQNRPQGGDSTRFENHWSKISYDKKAEEDNKNMFTNKHIQQLQAPTLQRAVRGISCLVLLPSSCNDPSLHSSFSNNS